MMPGTRERRSPSGPSSRTARPGRELMIPIVCTHCHAVNRRRRTTLEADPAPECPECNGKTDVRSILADLPRNVLLEGPSSRGRRSEFP